MSFQKDKLKQCQSCNFHVLWEVGKEEPRWRARHIIACLVKLQLQRDGIRRHFKPDAQPRARRYQHIYAIWGVEFGEDCEQES